MKRRRTELTQQEFMTEVRRRAVKLSLNVELSDSWFRDHRKHALLPAGCRGPNRGKAPTYTFGPKALRRALQLARMRSWGIVDRSEIRVMLFASGYSVSADEAREALVQVYRTAAKRLLANIRSGYVKTGRRPAGRHRSSLLKSFGTVDPLLERSGLALSVDDLIPSFCAAIDYQAPKMRQVEAIKIGEIVFSNKTSPEIRAGLLTSTISGMLAVDVEADANDDDGILRVIGAASAVDLERAALIGRLIRGRMRYFGNTKSEKVATLEAAFGLIGKQARKCPSECARQIAYLIRMKDILPIVFAESDRIVEALDEGIIEARQAIARLATVDEHPQ